MIQPRLDPINHNEVLMYLGNTCGEIPAHLDEEIDRCQGLLYPLIRARITYRVFPVRDGVLQGIRFPLLGQDIHRHLEDCSHAILMAATLGPDVETLLMRWQVTDMAQAVILDSCASCAIENICNNFEADLRQECHQQGKYLTDRFSPGYGDMPIVQQQDFCQVLDTSRRIGLSVSQSGILLPRKSVTAVLGVSSTPRKRRSSGCANCNLFRSCTIRKDGKSCG